MPLSKNNLIIFHIYFASAISVANFLILQVRTRHFPGCCIPPMYQKNQKINNVFELVSGSSKIRPALKVRLVMKRQVRM